jgi:hypothetical protein
MRVRRCREEERPLEGDLAGGGVEEVRSAHDLGHTLGSVVHDDRELVRVGAIGALHDEVADGDLEVFGDGTEEKIFEGE